MKPRFLTGDTANVVMRQHYGIGNIIYGNSYRIRKPISGENLSLLTSVVPDVKAYSSRLVSVIDT